MNLAEFNAADAARARAAARVWAAVPWWADAVAAGRPYPDVDALARYAARAAASWDAADLDAALAHHPRIGQKPTGTGADAAASRREQAAVGGAPAEVAEAIAEANAAYEARFGRVFLIRATGRSPAEMLAEARRRLGNDAASEAGEALEQLTQIAVVRLRHELGSDDATEGAA
ncbi:MAG: 2-oxo-4-hydroxy-4-carboxy-5-ureidoimidazoline decarboxylase [Nigerium sp.]|nr:2-oxo-4-hydroxy-4-carboxy-5-ureidoimidazoline decarboxylase [Nigerium sp.]